MPPLQGSELLLHPTQGYALGYFLSPLQGSGGVSPPGQRAPEETRLKQSRGLQASLFSPRARLEGEKMSAASLSVVYGLLSIVYCPWSVVCGPWSVVCGLWSVVCGLWSEEF